MWCLPCCFKPSTSEDQFEAETRQVIQASRFEADTQEAKMLSLAIHEDEQLSLAIKESSRQQEEDEERRRNRELEKDEQIAKALQYEEREKKINNETALGEQEEDEQLRKAVRKSLKDNNKKKQFEEQMEKDEQIAKGLQYVEREKEINNETALGDQEEDELLHRTVLESLKENNKRKQCEEQVEKDEQLALVVQERLNMEKYPTQIEENKRIPPRAPSDVKDKGKRKQFEDDQVENDKQHALMFQERLNMVKSPPRHDNDQQVIWESLKGTGQRTQSKDEVEEDGELPKVNPPSSMYGGSNSVIEDGRSVNVSGWHPECLICDACDKQIDKDHVSNSRGNFHKACYDRFCYICKGKIKNYGKHPFWKELYCLAHETDGTPKCCSCERLEPKGMDSVMLDDGRRLCLECMDSAVMDSHECQPLHFEMREFFEGLNMKIDKEFPFLLVEQQALNKAEKEEKIDSEFEGLTRGICLSEEQNVDSVTQRPTMGPDKKLRRVETEAQRVVRKCKCEVTAILIVYGLPRLLTGYILAHEMMHAYFRLNGHRNLNKLLEEGICQVLAHMWLESQTYTAVDATAAAASSSASSSSGSASKKGKCSDFEKELVGFFKNQIETDDTPLYGEGFRKVNEMKTHFNSLEATIKEILRRSGR